MSLIKCPECGKDDVSSSAMSCPNCGYDIKAHYNKIRAEEIRQKNIKKKRELREKEYNSILLKEIEAVRVPNHPPFINIKLIIGTLCLIEVIWITWSFVRKGEDIPSLFIILNSIIGLGGIFLIKYGYVSLKRDIQIYNKYHADKSKYTMALAEQSAKQKLQQIDLRKQIESQREKRYTNKDSGIDTLYCPKCHSTAVTTTARGANWKFGLLGASKTVNRCGKCGYTWKPKL